ncbi:DUF4190 domain-containing protein [Kocuria koreensis]|jgi:hypothetical protein|uniref:DUF4190 domain-containing protein n=1 Tax=Rothia koreensis TaxID=592378 RepID=A0A7M3SW73_9MICC|nr:DUF4190 domain-containing protein [Rothia koreensis]
MENQNDSTQHQTQGFTPQHSQNQSQSTFPSHMTLVQAPSQPKGMSIASMVIGLVNILMGWTIILPIIGLIFGIVGLRKEPAGRGMAITGIVLSGVIVAFWASLTIAGFGILGSLIGSVSTEGSY